MKVYLIKGKTTFGTFNTVMVTVDKAEVFNQLKGGNEVYEIEATPVKEIAVKYPEKEDG